MDIYPEDLEPTYCARIKQTRTLMYANKGHAVDGRIWGLLLGFIPGAVFPGVIFAAVAHADFGLFLGAVTGSAVGYALGSRVDRDGLSRQDTQKMTEEEISLIGREEGDPLKMENLGLLFKLISTRPFQDATVDQSVRSAIRDIGCGIARLPGQPAEELLLDARTFQGEASQLAAKAARESDPVVAASFQRQSAARSQRAEAISRNSALARRNQILRHEMGEHIQALKTMLDTMALGSGSDDHNLAALAENIQQVAIEARSLTEAKQELASALGEGQDGKADAILERPQFQGLSGH